MAALLDPAAASDAKGGSGVTVVRAAGEIGCSPCVAERAGTAGAPASTIGRGVAAIGACAPVAERGDVGEIGACAPVAERDGIGRAGCTIEGSGGAGSSPCCSCSSGDHSSDVGTTSCRSTSRVCKLTDGHEGGGGGAAAGEATSGGGGTGDGTGEGMGASTGGAGSVWAMGDDTSGGAIGAAACGLRRCSTSRMLAGRLSKLRICVDAACRSESSASDCGAIGGDDTCGIKEDGVATRCG